jgi:hypothetical protein
MLGESEDFKDATNQPIELPILRMLQDLPFSLDESVGSGLCCVLPSTGAMPRLHASSLAAGLSAHRRKPRQKCNAPESC